MHPTKVRILGELKAGTTQRHLIKLPGAALANDEPRPVISVAGAKPGPLLVVNAGVHGGEYPAVEAMWLHAQKKSRWRSVCRTWLRSVSPFNRAKGTEQVQAVCRATRQPRTKELQRF